MAFLHRTIAGLEERTEAHWVVERRGVERPIGMIGFRLGAHGAELGYVLERRAWGQGYATEAGRALVDWALGEPAIYRVWAVCDVEHRPRPASSRSSGWTVRGDFVAGASTRISAPIPATAGATRA